MLSTALLSLTVLGQGVLPGSDLSLERAKRQARFIVVAEVGKTGGPLEIVGAGSLLLWTELKPSAVLKGEVNGEELNRHPLAIRAMGKERLPKTGDELVFFIGDDREDFSISKILPKTEENVQAIKAVMPAPLAIVEKGRLDPVVRSGGGRPIAKPDPPLPYRGTKIIPDRGAAGEMRKLQDEFAAEMSRVDPKPEDRQAHFAWLDKNEHVRRYGVHRIGWYGDVLGCEPRPGGGWFVKVVIRPWLFSKRVRHTSVADTVEETYEFVGGRVRLVESDAATAKPGRQVFPFAL